MPPIYIFHKYWTLLPPSSSHVTLAVQPLLLLSPRTSPMAAAAAPFHKVLLRTPCRSSPWDPPPPPPSPPPPSRNQGPSVEHDERAVGAEPEIVEHPAQRVHALLATVHRHHHAGQVASSHGAVSWLDSLAPRPDRGASPGSEGSRSARRDRLVACRLLPLPFSSELVFSLIQFLLDHGTLKNHKKIISSLNRTLSLS